MSRPIINLIMMVIVLALIYVAAREPGNLPDAEPPTLTDLRTDQVIRLLITHPGNPPVTLERRSGIWHITTPRELPADAGRINMLTQLVEAEISESYARDYIEPKELGLDPPALSVQVNDGVRIDFGGTHPLNGQRYVTTGEQIHLITDKFFQLLNTDVYGLISSRLLAEGADIRALKLPDHVLNLQDGRWQLEPDDPSVSADAIETLLNAWRNDRALWVSGHAAGDGLPVIEVQLADDATPLRFTLNTQNDEFVLGRPDLDIDYHMTEESAQRLLQFAAPAVTGEDTAPTAGDNSENASSP